MSTNGLFKAAAEIFDLSAVISTTLMSFSSLSQTNFTRLRKKKLYQSFPFYILSEDPYKVVTIAVY